MEAAHNDTEFDFSAIYDVVADPDQYDAFMRQLLSSLETTESVEHRLGSNALGVHWGKASLLVDKVTPWRTESAPETELDEFLASKMQAMMAINAEGHIVGTNSAARNLYNLGTRPTLDNLPLSETDLSRLTQRVDRIFAREAYEKGPNNIELVENQINNQMVLFRLDKHFDRGANRVSAVLMTNEFYWPSHLAPILQDLFSLTSAEIQVIRLMMSGANVKEIAQKRSTSKTTVRTQLKSIFSKTETPSQMACLRMVFGLALMHERKDGHLIAARIQANAEAQNYPRENQRQVLLLKSRRKIDYSIFGAKNGPGLKGHVLFFHDQALGDTWFKDAVIAAAEAGLQIIAPLRPGFGRTTLYRGEWSDPTEFAPDVEQLLDHLNVTTATIMSLRSGLVHALAVASLMPDRFTRITAANPILPVLSDDDLEGTNGYNRLIPTTRLHFPKALRFMCKAGFAMVTAKGPEAFAKAVVRDAPKDLDWVSRPEILPLIVAGLPIHREQGYLGNYGDIAYADDWTDLLKSSPVPVRMVIGEDDRNVQWKSARRWAAELPHVELRVLPDSGYFVQHQHPSQFLEWLTADLQLCESADNQAAN